MTWAKRKYRKGDSFSSFDYLLRWLYSGKWVYYHHKVMHPAFILNMGINSVYNDVFRGYIHQAILNDPPKEEPKHITGEYKLNDLGDLEWSK
jgi:hypothetical protein